MTPSSPIPCQTVSSICVLLIEVCYVRAVITNITDGIAIGVGLIRIRYARAVIPAVSNPVTIRIAIRIAVVAFRDRFTLIFIGIAATRVVC